MEKARGRATNAAIVVVTERPSALAANLLL